MVPPRWPLPDDLIIPEILLRIPPDDPASIARASAVCKSWRRVLSDPAFLTHYHALHRHNIKQASILDFLHNPMDHESPGFMPTTSFRLPTPDCPMRHDPITDDQHRLPHIHMADIYSNAAVICTAAGCDHHRGGCIPGGPFIVAFTGVERNEEEYGGSYRDTHVELYSCKTRVRSVNINVQLVEHQTAFDLEWDRPAALIGDSVYFVGTSGFLLRYWFGPLLRLGYPEMVHHAGIRTREILMVIDPPRKKDLGKVVVMTAEGGGLGLACLNLNRIALTIHLKKLMIPLANPKRRAYLSGVIPDNGSVVFVSTEDGVFKIELQPSLQARKVSDMSNNVKIVYPFVSFYTETLLERLACCKTASAGGRGTCDL
ncbi:hypothetical protein QOZ80_4BG0348880 [Eleusine coracana subsp. coracana]|nr:hypothetical protein QOZ80_4BG0348880 [Eleusine coracana subsp. coracana]